MIHTVHGVPATCSLPDACMATSGGIDSPGATEGSKGKSHERLLLRDNQLHPVRGIVHQDETRASLHVEAQTVPAAGSMTGG